MDTLSSPSAKLTTTGEHREEELGKRRLDLVMDTISSLSVKLTTGEHRREEELRKGRLVLFVLLTANSGLLTYLLWGDLVSVASVGVTYVAVGLLLGRRFACWEPITDGARRQWLAFVICFLYMSLCLLQVSRALQVSSRLARTAASSTSAPMLVAAAAAAALGVGGCSAYLLHRRSWSKQQRHELIFLPLRQDPRS